jgi:hypothetical protein
MPSLERVRSPTWQTQHGRHPQWSSVVLSEAKIVSVTLPAGRALREHRDLPGGHRRWHADECEAIANDDTATELVVPPLTISGANASQQRRQLLKVDMLPLLCQHRALATRVRLSGQPVGMRHCQLPSLKGAIDSNRISRVRADSVIASILAAGARGRRTLCGVSGNGISRSRPASTHERRAQ